MIINDANHQICINSNSQITCEYHNLIHCDWIMCPRCFDTLCTILRSHCTTSQFNAILAILLGDGCHQDFSEETPYEEGQTTSEETTSCDELSPHSNALKANALWEPYETSSTLSNATQLLPGLIGQPLKPPGLKKPKDCTQLAHSLHDCVEDALAFKTSAETLTKLTLERHDHFDQDVHNFVNNLVDWYEYISDDN